jgi:hypothetical protein
MKVGKGPAMRAFCLLTVFVFASMAPLGGRRGKEIAGGVRWGGPSVCWADVIEGQEGIIHKTLPQGPPGAEERVREERKKAEWSLEMLRHLWIDLNPQRGNDPKPQLPPSPAQNP